MNLELLIDNIVRQTMVLIAQLATAAGGRTPLSHVAGQVFLNLVRELKAQGLGHKVIADMFGLALRTYHDRVSRLSESATDRGTSLWEAVLAHVRKEGAVERGELLRRFHRDDEASVRAVLNDLVGSGLLYRSGRGDRTTFRAASDEELSRVDGGDRESAVEYLVWVALYRRRRAGLADLAAELGLGTEPVQRALNKLVEDGRASRIEGNGSTDYRCDVCVIPFGETRGWEAAVFDHFQAVVTAVAAKISSGANRALPDEATGGSTYHFDLFTGHPLEREVLGLLASVRRQASALRTAVDEHPLPDGEEMYRVVFYAGQNVIGDRMATKAMDGYDAEDQSPAHKGEGP
jgi:hypothetical protein